MNPNLNVFKFAICPWRYPSNWIPNIKYIFRGFKWAIQRATKGYCDSDLWDLDTFYTKLIINTLKGFTTQKLHGAPYEYYDAKNDSIQAWIDKVNEVRQKFEDFYAKETDGYTYKKDEFKFDEAWAALGEIYHNLWD